MRAVINSYVAKRLNFLENYVEYVNYVVFEIIHVAWIRFDWRYNTFRNNHPIFAIQPLEKGLSLPVDWIMYCFLFVCQVEARG